MNRLHPVQPPGPNFPGPSNSPNQYPYQPQAPAQPQYQPQYQPQAPAQSPYQPQYQPQGPAQSQYQPQPPAQPQYQPQPPAQPQYQPQPPYQPPPTQPRGGISAGLMAVIAVVIVVAVVIPIVYFTVISPPSKGDSKNGPQGNGTVENTLGLAVTTDLYGNWLINVASGSAVSAGDVTMLLVNRSNSAAVLSVKVNAIAVSDGTFNDNNQDGKINAGDSILLKATGTAEAGMKVQFLKGGDVIGTINELPN